MKKQILLAIFFLIVSALTATAQSVEQAAKNARDQFTDIKNRSVEMERVKREANKKSADEDYVVEFPKIKEDFEEIQKINITKLQLDNSKTSLNYKSILKYASEINQRAKRLNVNLFPLNQEKESNDNSQTSETKDLKSLLSLLNTSITSFAHSPMFANLSVVNLQDSQNAQKNLDDIIELSKAIREKAKRFSKENSK